MKPTSPLGRLPCVLPCLLAALAFVPADARAQSGNQGLVVLEPGGLWEHVGPGIDSLGEAADYLITPELGRLRGSTLVYEFRDFGVGPGEVATVSGPDPLGAPGSIDTVILRVASGVESVLEGTLRSTLPGARVVLLVPAGAYFGPESGLDLDGPFEVSSAPPRARHDDDEDEGDDDESDDDEPSTWGADARIEVDGAKLANAAGIWLRAPTVTVHDGAAVQTRDAALRITAPDLLWITDSGTYVQTAARKPPDQDALRGGDLLLEGGEIRVEGDSQVRVVGNAGSTAPSPFDFGVAADADPIVGPAGSIAILGSERVRIANGGEGAGPLGDPIGPFGPGPPLQVSIARGSVWVFDRFSDLDPGRPDVFVHAPRVELETERSVSELPEEPKALIHTDRDVVIGPHPETGREVETFSLDGAGPFFVSALGEEVAQVRAGQIAIGATSIQIGRSARIQVPADPHVIDEFEIRLTAGEEIRLSDAVVSAAFGFQAFGRIRLQAAAIHLDGAGIRTVDRFAIGPRSESIELRASDRIEIRGSRAVLVADSGEPGSLALGSRSSEVMARTGTSLSVRGIGEAPVGMLVLEDGAVAGTESEEEHATLGNGGVDAGDVEIAAVEVLLRGGAAIQSVTRNQARGTGIRGAGGSIRIEAAVVDLAEGAQILSGSFSNGLEFPGPTSLPSGNGGPIELDVADLRLRSGSAIEARSEGLDPPRHAPAPGGDSGEIRIGAPGGKHVLRRVELWESAIRTTAIVPEDAPVVPRVPRAGGIEIDAAGSVILGRGSRVGSTASDETGAVAIRGRKLRLGGASEIATEGARGGDVSIEVRRWVGLRDGSAVRALAEDGADVGISARRVTVCERCAVEATGRVEIEASGGRRSRDRGERERSGSKGFQQRPRGSDDGDGGRDRGGDLDSPPRVEGGERVRSGRRDRNAYPREESSDDVRSERRDRADRPGRDGAEPGAQHGRSRLPRRGLQPDDGEDGGVRARDPRARALRRAGRAAR